MSRDRHDRKGWKKRGRKGLLLLTMLPLLGGCVMTNVSEVELWMEPGLVQAQDQIHVRYSDGTTASVIDYLGEIRADDLGVEKRFASYQAHTDPTKTIVGMYVTDGTVSWVPAFHFTKRGLFSKQIAVDRAGWEKPTIAAASVRVTQFTPDPTMKGVYSLVVQVLGADGRPVDGLTELFAHSNASNVRFIDADTLDSSVRVQSQSVAAVGGQASLKLISAQSKGILTKEEVLAALSYASGARALTRETVAQPAPVTEAEGTVRLVVGQAPLRLSLTDLGIEPIVNFPLRQETVTTGVYGAPTLTTTVYGGITRSLMGADSQSPGIVQATIDGGGLTLIPVSAGRTTVTGTVYENYFSTVSASVYQLPTTYRTLLLPISVSPAAGVNVGTPVRTILEGTSISLPAAGPSPSASLGFREEVLPVRYRSGSGGVEAFADSAVLDELTRVPSSGSRALVFALSSGDQAAASLTLQPEQVGWLKQFMIDSPGLTAMVFRYRSTDAVLPVGLIERVAVGLGVRMTIQLSEGSPGSASQSIILSPDDRYLSYLGRDGLTVGAEGAVARVQVVSASEGRQP